MRAIATLQDPDEGSIHLGDLDVLANKEEARRRLGYLPQEFGVYPKVYCEDMLDHFAVLKGVTDAKERKELVHALLRQVNLWDVRYRKLGTFSGGMRQRFGSAQALTGAPSLIIVDEPTAGRDPEERNRVLNLLAESGEKVVVILSTHIVADVTDLRPRMAIIGQGQVLLTGEPREAIRGLDGRVWRRTIDKAELDSYRARMTILSTRLAGGRTLLHVLADTAPEPGFEPVAPDLEDVCFGRLRAQAMARAAVLGARTGLRRARLRRRLHRHGDDRRRQRQRAAQRADGDRAADHRVHDLRDARRRRASRRRRAAGFRQRPG